MKLEGRVVIVTGGTGGIGRAVCDRFTAEGAKLVVVVDRAEPGYELRPGQTFRQGSVSDPQFWGTLVAELEGAHGSIDILINNAGIIDHTPLHEVDLDKWDEVIAVNQTAVMLGMRAVIPGMLRKGKGAIINTSSIWGTVAVEGVASYHASKGAVRNLSKNAALTYAKRGIRVNSVHPGLIRTPIVDQQAEEKNAWVIAQTPMGHMGRPEDIAAGMLFLASDEAAFITGTELYIDGGYTAQ
ncbi:glucose 1-dehydrogenase [Pseudomonas gingeri]|nr:glucose 1-dehydrogenase [Pseudomonas gingeri]